MKIIKNNMRKARDKFLQKVENELLSVKKDLEITNQKLDVYGEEVSRLDNMVTVLPIAEKLVLSKIFSGLKIYVDPTDVAVAPHIIFDRIWESSVTHAWLSVLRPGQTIIDIGANFGYFGLLAAQPQYVEPQKVIFFEANPDLIPYISKSLSVNGLHKISKVENIAISSKRGEANLTVLEDFTGCSSLHSLSHLDSYLHGKMPIKASKKFTVKTVSIDDYCRDNSIGEVDLIKMDIEGFEEEAYKGMKKMVANSPNLIFFIEFTRESYDNPRKFYDKLLNDFKYLYLINDAGGLFEPETKTYEEVVEVHEIYVMLVLSQKVIVKED